MKSKLAILIAAVTLFDLAAADFELVKDRQAKCCIILPEKKCVQSSKYSLKTVL